MKTFIFNNSITGESYPINANNTKHAWDILKNEKGSINNWQLIGGQG